MNRLSKLMTYVVLTVLLSASVGIALAASQSAKDKPTATGAAVPPTPTTQVYQSKESIPGLVYQSQEAIAGSPVNPFNRLLKKASRPHLPPAEDGIHDAGNEGTFILQHPMDAYEDLPQTPSGLGNGVHWVKAIDDGVLKPRWERTDPTAEPMVMDMNILRVPKSSMPNVVFPHRQHTEWLACANCHPAIFIPQKGANQINMAAIILGQKCGVCHGKVAFPVSECKRCHSQPKTVAVNGGGVVKP